MEAAAALHGAVGRAEWRAEARQAWNRNRLDLQRPVSTGSPYFAHPHGHAMGSLVGTRVTWRDIDGDGLIRGTCIAPGVCEIQRGATTEVLGSSVPKRVGSTAASLRVGALRVGALADWQGGVYRYASALRLYCSAGFCEESYVRGERLAEQARLRGPAASDLWIQDASFVRLREVALTLAAPARLLRGVADGVELTFAGRNLAVWTGYEGFDPETATSDTSPFAAVELFTQPPLRTVTTRIDVRF